MTVPQQHLLYSLTTLSLMAPIASMASQTGFANGFYLGAKIGAQELMTETNSLYNLITVEIDNNDGGLQDSGNFSHTAYNQAYKTNLMGNLALGYAAVLSHYFLAAELSVNLSEEQETTWEIPQNIDADTFSVYGGSTLEVTLQNPDIIFDLRPGLLLTPNTLLYSRIGIAFNRAVIEQSSSTIQNYATDGIIMPVPSVLDAEDVYGMRVGLGLEYKLTQNLAMGVDYVFTDYGSIDGNLTSVTTQLAANGPTDITTITSSLDAPTDITKNTVTAGFNWYFGSKKPHHHAVDK